MPVFLATSPATGVRSVSPTAAAAGTHTGEKVTVPGPESHELPEHRKSDGSFF